MLITGDDTEVDGDLVARRRVKLRYKRRKFELKTGELVGVVRAMETVETLLMSLRVNSKLHLTRSRKWQCL